MNGLTIYATFLTTVCINHRPKKDYYKNITDSFLSLFFSIDTQRNGLVFIFDMTDSKYGNFDYDLSIKILTMLKVGVLLL